MTQSAISIQNVCKSYHSHKKALHNVSLSVAEGDFFGLIGPNGAGKTTLISILTSLTKKDSGTIKIFDHDFDTHQSLAKQLIGVVPQEINFQTFETPLQIIISQAGYYGIKAKEAMPWAEELLKTMELWGKKDQQARMLSGGMKRRLMIARALINKPKLIFLDEPTAGVDIEIRRSMWQLMKEINKTNKTTIVLTTHYLEEAENLCNRIAIINEGGIMQTSNTRELLKSTQNHNYIVDINEQTNDTAPKVPFSYTLLDSQTCRISLSHDQTINDAIKALNQNGIQVLSLKNETNRLEQIIHDMIHAKKER